MSRALLLSPDDQAVSAITAVLEEMAVSCERPLDGASAALKLNSHSFDLVLVDCENLPAAKLIFDVCRRGKSGSNPIPIAIVDGRAGLPTAFRLGAELILTKPVSKDNARSTIRTAVGRVRKDEPAQETVAVDVSNTSAVSRPSSAAAAAATARPAPSTTPVAPLASIVSSKVTGPGVAATPAALESEVSAVVEDLPVESALVVPPDTSQSPAPVPKMSAAVQEAPVLPPPVEPAPESVTPPTSKQSVQPLPALKHEQEKTSDAAVLAKLDKVKNDEIARPAPVLSSFNSPQREPSSPKKRGGPVVLLFLLLAGGGFYAAWTYLPGFREIVQPQIERVSALAGQITEHRARPQAKARAPMQNAPKATPIPVQATPVDHTSTNITSAAASSPSPAVPEASATTPTATSPTGATPASAAGSMPVSASAPVASTKTAVASVDSEQTAASLSIQHPPRMDKNVVILSSKGAEKRLVHKVPPVYSKEAKAAGLEGTVVLKVVVSNTGKVANVSLVEGNPALAKPAIQAVKQWQYRPYVRDGNNLAFQTIVLLDFQQ
jgi:protein TonB